LGFQSLLHPLRYAVCLRKYNTPTNLENTLALAAQKHGRRWVLIETVPEYAEIARRRLASA
jgi:hypothetical protein